MGHLTDLFRHRISELALPNRRDDDDEVQHVQPPAWMMGQPSWYNAATAPATATSRPAAAANTQPADARVAQPRTPRQTQVADAAGGSAAIPQYTGEKIDPSTSYAGTKAGSAGVVQGTYNALRNSGFSHPGATHMIGEINRENGLNPSLMFGSHSDPKNQATNVGLISWQGDRRNQVMNHVGQNGGLDTNGKMIPNQGTLQAQTNFMAQEMQKRNPSAWQYMSNPDVQFDRNTAMKHMGGPKSYIAWDMNNPKYYANGVNSINKGVDLANRYIPANDNAVPNNVAQNQSQQKVAATTPQPSPAQPSPVQQAQTGQPPPQTTPTPQPKPLQMAANTNASRSEPLTANESHINNGSRRNTMRFTTLLRQHLKEADPTMAGLQVDFEEREADPSKYHLGQNLHPASEMDEDGAGGDDGMAAPYDGTQMAGMPGGAGATPQMPIGDEELQPIQPGMQGQQPGMQQPMEAFDPFDEFLDYVLSEAPGDNSAANLNQQELGLINRYGAQNFAPNMFQAPTQATAPAAVQRQQRPSPAAPQPAAQPAAAQPAAAPKLAATASATPYAGLGASLHASGPSGTAQIQPAGNSGLVPGGAAGAAAAAAGASWRGAPLAGQQFGNRANQLLGRPPAGGAAPQPTLSNRGAQLLNPATNGVNPPEPGMSSRGARLLNPATNGANPIGANTPGVSNRGAQILNPATNGSAQTGSRLGNIARGAGNMISRGAGAVGDALGGAANIVGRGAGAVGDALGGAASIAGRGASAAAPFAKAALNPVVGGLALGATLGKGTMANAEGKPHGGYTPPPGWDKSPAAGAPVPDGTLPTSRTPDPRGAPQTPAQTAQAQTARPSGPALPNYDPNTLQAARPVAPPRAGPAMQTITSQPPPAAPGGTQIATKEWAMNWNDFIVLSESDRKGF